MRIRLRPAWSPGELADIYPAPHDAALYGYGHELRVDTTIALGVATVKVNRLSSVADLSTGNAAIPKRIALNCGRHCTVTLGDFAAGYEHRGPIEETLDRLTEPVDLFVLSETVEHLDDPDGTLTRIRSKAKHLLLSTPIGETDLGNREHYWGWDQAGVADMLAAAGWDVAAARRVDITLPDTYSYQIWAVT